MPERTLAHALRAVLVLLLAAMLGGCALLDLLPRSSPGRPADEVRRQRQASGTGPPAPAQRQGLDAPVHAPVPAPVPAPSLPGDHGQGGAADASAFRPRHNADARALAASLSPASQSLGGFADLLEPLEHSIAYLSRKPSHEAALVQPGGSLAWGQLLMTAQELREVLPRLDADPGLLAERFVWYQLAPVPLATGYYSPEVPARLTRQPGFETPLYGLPPDLRRASPEEERQGRPKVYRAQAGAIMPYHDRRAIDLDGALAGQGLEIAWVPSPLDAFVLQTEGAGVLVLDDGSRRAVQFKATNGHAFTGLGELLLSTGTLPRERLTRADIRSWCDENPQAARELMAGNRSFVFFELRQGPNLGAMGKPLTALVSLATDPSLLPLGAVAVLDLGLPAANGSAPRTLKGLVLAQDTGAAIRGHRLDLYLGGGETAARMEAGMRASAGLHLLVSKNALRSNVYTRGQ